MARAPLTPDEKASCITTWQELDAEHDGRFTELAEDLIEMEPEERHRALDYWMAVIDVMKATEKGVQS